MPEPKFERQFEPLHGQPVPLAEGLVRVTAGNSGPFTFHGTNSYLIGTQTLALIDPGPEDEAHRDALMAAIAGRPLSHVFVTHTHRDHSPLARWFARQTGAKILAEGPHRSARPLRRDEANPLQESADHDFVPDRTLVDGECIEGDGWSIKAIATPGHTANHMAFAFEDQDIVFSGDHVMAWSTSIIAPPDGSMSDFMTSLDRLLAREDRLLLPGHGGAVTAPRSFMRALKSHRRMREATILDQLGKGHRSIMPMVETIYRDTDRKLHGAAALTVLAHLEDLAGRGLVVTEDGKPASLDSVYALA